MKDITNIPGYVFDSADLVFCVALWGGFATGNWWPFALVFTIHGLTANQIKTAIIRKVEGGTKEES